MKSQALKIKRVFVNFQACNGCRICELRCSFQHFGFFSPAHSRIHVHKQEYEGIDKPKVCRQCVEPYCIPACPQNAISKHPETHHILVDEEKCDGCGLCVTACPFDAITLTPEKGLALICDTCNGDPQCVAYCPENALVYLNATEYRKYYKNTKH